jgi:serine/threonine protein kinase
VVKIIQLASTSPLGITVDINMPLIFSMVGKRWPNVVTIHDAWKEETNPESFCIQMDFYGTTLRVCWKLEWRFTRVVWFDILWGIANGLSQAHSSNIVHGDLKGSNSDHF